MCNKFLNSIGLKNANHNEKTKQYISYEKAPAISHRSKRLSVRLSSERLLGIMPYKVPDNSL